MYRVIASFFERATREFSAERAVANVRGDLVDLERALASVDAIATRLAARAAYGHAA